MDRQKIVAFFTWLILCCILLLSACKKEDNTYQGYVDSKMRFISSNFTGLLTKLYVIEGNTVKKGDPLFKLEPFPEQWNIDQNLAKITIAKAQIEAFTIKASTAEDKYIRRQKLKTSNFADQEELDSTKADFAIAKEQLNEAKANLTLYQAQLDESQWSLGKKDILSNMDATVFDVFYYENEIVPAERPVLSLLSPEDIKIIFFVSETEISRLRMGQSINIFCDGCNKSYQAKISYISTKSEFTPPVIYSEQTRDKLVFLIEARSDLETSKVLHPGQPVTIKLGQ